jgi:hypothetical protein
MQAEAEALVVLLAVVLVVLAGQAEAEKALITHLAVQMALLVLLT